LIDTGKGSAAYEVAMLACRLCCHAGLHQLNKQHAEDIRVKKLTFWSAYTIERGLALIFGRAPILPDYDISTEMPEWPTELPGAGGTAFYASIQYAKLQGEIYKRLYCPEAQRSSESIKTQHANDLAFQLIAIRVLNSLLPSSVPLLTGFRIASSTLTSCRTHKN